jgi:branched-chain amino acid transport system ATP-binding protein
MSELRLDNLFRSFGSLVVTRHVSLVIPPGERHVIIGPNGAGKTSLIHQIGGQLTPGGGRILLGTTDITGWAPEQILRAGIARTFQKNNLFANLSVLENLRLAVQARRSSGFHVLRPADSHTGIHERAREILRQVRLERDASCLVRNLSYGEQRQLEIGMALAGDPQVLLLDEPTSGMSPAETTGMIDLVRSLPAELTLVMIEHDMNVVFSLADRITVLYYGEVLASGTPAQIQADERVREIYLGARH